MELARTTEPLAQQEFFSHISESLLPGLHYQSAFLDSAEEEQLIRTIGGLTLREAEYKEYRAKRRIASYGGKYDFDRHELLPAGPMPEFLHPLRARVAAWAQLAPEDFTHALIAEYRRGTQLGWHRDVPEFEIIAGVSLCGPCRMRFRPYPPDSKRRAFTLSIEPRSAYVLRDAARWDWQHSVAATPALRYSITFRPLRR